MRAGRRLPSNAGMQRFSPSRAVRALPAALLAALLLAAPAGAQDPPAPQRIAANVVAGGVDLSGLTAAEAAAKLRAELAPQAKRARSSSASPAAASSSTARRRRSS